MKQRLPEPGLQPLARRRYLPIIYLSAIDSPMNTASPARRSPRKTTKDQDKTSPPRQSQKKSTPLNATKKAKKKKTSERKLTTATEEDPSAKPGSTSKKRTKGGPPKKQYVEREKSVPKEKISEGKEKVVLEEQLSEDLSVSSNDKTEQHHSNIQDDLDERLSKESTALLKRDRKESKEKESCFSKKSGCSGGGRPCGTTYDCEQRRRYEWRRRVTS